MKEYWRVQDLHKMVLRENLGDKLRRNLKLETESYQPLTMNWASVEISKEMVTRCMIKIISSF